MNATNISNLNFKSLRKSHFHYLNSNNVIKSWKILENSRNHLFYLVYSIHNPKSKFWGVLLFTTAITKLTTPVSAW
jgi:hypothetical protein